MSLIQDCMKERLFSELVQSFVGDYDNMQSKYARTLNLDHNTRINQLSRKLQWFCID